MTNSKSESDGKMLNGKRIGCVVLNYNSGDEVKKLVNVIKEYNCIDRIAIVDNKSTEDAYEIFSRLATKKIDVIYNEKNYGYAKGNNIGIRFLINNYNVDFVCIVNPDVEFPEETLKKLIRIASSKEKTGIVSCNIITKGDIKQTSAWKLPDYNRCITECLALFNKIVAHRYIYPEVHKLQKVDVIQGAFFVANVEALKKVDFFDERTFLYYEENILAYKLKKMDYKNYLATDTFAYHIVSGSIDKAYSKTSKKLKLAQQSREIYIKYYLKKSILGIMFSRFCSILGTFEISIYQFVKNRRRSN